MGLVPVRRFFRWWLSPDLVIGLFPEWYATPQPDWPPQLKLAGFGQFDGACGELSEEVRAFCDAGSPPIVFTLGTGMMHASAFFREAAAACESIGARGLLLTEYPNLIPSGLPSTIRHRSFAPFRALLPLRAAIVHHGGVGTTAAALEAGCPQLLFPLAWDQPDNAARIKQFGVGTVLGSRQRSRRHLARALADLMTPEVRARCRMIATQAITQNGLQIAVAWVEALANIHRQKLRQPQSQVRADGT